MGTAPRRPTQQTYNRLLKVILRKGRRHNKTLTGRAKMIIKIPISRPSQEMLIRSFGLTSKPRVRNMIIWKSQAVLSKKLVIFFLYTIRRFPTTSPAIYTAR